MKQETYIVEIATPKDYDDSYEPIFVTNDKTVVDTLNSLKKGWYEAYQDMKKNTPEYLLARERDKFERELTEKVFGEYAKYIKDFDVGKSFSYSTLPLVLK